MQSPRRFAEGATRSPSARARREAGKPDQHAIAETVAAADASTFAVQFGAAADVIAAADGFGGKIVIDAANPLRIIDGGLGLTTGYTTSGAEQIAAQAPRARVFKGFDQTGWENIQTRVRILRAR